MYQRVDPDEEDAEPGDYTLTELAKDISQKIRAEEVSRHDGGRAPGADCANAIVAKAGSENSRVTSDIGKRRTYPESFSAQSCQDSGCLETCESTRKRARIEQLMPLADLDQSLESTASVMCSAIDGKYGAPGKQILLVSDTTKSYVSIDFIGQASKWVLEHVKLGAVILLHKIKLERTCNGSLKSIVVVESRDCFLFNNDVFEPNLNSSFSGIEDLCVSQAQNLHEYFCGAFGPHMDILRKSVFWTKDVFSTSVDSLSDVLKADKMGTFVTVVCTVSEATHYGSKAQDLGGVGYVLSDGDTLGILRYWTQPQPSILTFMKKMHAEKVKVKISNCKVRFSLSDRSYYLSAMKNTKLEPMYTTNQVPRSFMSLRHLSEDKQIQCETVRVYAYIVSFSATPKPIARCKLCNPVKILDVRHSSGCRIEWNCGNCGATFGQSSDITESEACETINGLNWEIHDINVTLSDKHDADPKGFEKRLDVLVPGNVVKELAFGLHGGFEEDLWEQMKSLWLSARSRFWFTIKYDRCLGKNARPRVAAKL
eukprot:CAMPEP_0203761350 /NCGR_PEP_ID=MMETSP0098-20131031/14460_1 /ASSEMBLY_ACC=CAM_ASM_000208 /TAXON_ID=96639 /ORGANISM=" , Strain NY0313808BC1" /LENGTH=539 /DNA_ID=CAMNT_0050655311 /DNA_START=170 /DNA_END=1785 /DNA_ORIENTATION=-